MPLIKNKPTKTVGNYLKLKDGDDYSIRVLGEPLEGFTCWTAKGADGKSKGLRAVTYEELASRTDLDPTGSIQRFWAFPILNRTLEIVQIWEITQKTIIDPITSIDNKYDLTTLDIDVSRKGTGKDDTKYWVMPSPGTPAPLNAKEKAAIDETPLNLVALFSGGDPFDPNVQPAPRGSDTATAGDDDTPF